jgi:hypothetical protein
VKKYKRPTLHKIKTVGAETDSADLRESREKEDEKCMCVNHSDAQTPIKAPAHTLVYSIILLYSQTCSIGSILANSQENELHATGSPTDPYCMPA